jgi:hypothetical protein
MWKYKSATKYAENVDFVYNFKCFDRIQDMHWDYLLTITNNLEDAIGVVVASSLYSFGKILDNE